MKKILMRGTSRYEEEDLRVAARQLGADLQIEISEEENTVPLKRDFDLYILHLSDVDKNDLLALRKEQPWSKIVSVRGMPTKIDSEIWDLLYQRYYPGINVERAISLLQILCENELPRSHHQKSY